jgi:phage gp45-like
MPLRGTLNQAIRGTQTAMSRAIVEEVDDNNLWQTVKKAHVYYSESPSDFERVQMVGMTAVPLKQDQDEQKQQEEKSGELGSKESEFEGLDQDSEWNRKQPRGKSAEAVMLYMNGQRAHPVALVDDRRVRPYGMKAGESAHYCACGCGSMVYHRNRGDNKDGSMVVVTNEPGYEKRKQQSGQQGGGSSSPGAGTFATVGPSQPSQSQQQQEVERFGSMRHVEKKAQSREIKKGQEQEAEKYKHEGDSVNTEVRVTKQKIEFYDGETLVGWYDRQAKKWTFKVGNFSAIVDNGQVIGQNSDKTKSFRVDGHHTHIRWADNSIFVDAAGCWSTKAINIKPDDC